jgi:hypothetical protein
MITCRAQLGPDCFGTWRASEEDLDDSTWRTVEIEGASIPTVVCFACYIRIDPYMRMNQPDIPAEADRGIARYRQAEDAREGRR